ncbi:MAG: hypothetical protein Q9213_008027 [Squamulea squamosa]
MTNFALAQGCDVSGNGSVRRHRKPSNPLFSISTGILNTSGTETARKVIETLHDIGYDAEERNSDGFTSLLYTASMCTPMVPWLEKCVLDLTEDEVEDWVNSAEDDDSPASNADNDHSSNAANHSSMDGHEIYELEDSDPDSPAPTTDDDYYSEAASHSFADGHEVDEIEDLNADDAPAHRYWRFLRQCIRPMLKRRMRSKVLLLLQAGCDPNHLDDNGESPSGFAQREGIWDEWTWALRQSGYIYDNVRDIWKKTTVSA